MAQKLSQLAQELKPYIQPWIAQSLGVSGGNATPAVGVHDLGGALHRGSVIDSQIPQALLRDGSRSITGNIAMNDGKTIDGVDPSVHVADPNAHHARLHSITGTSDHSLTGSKWQIVGATAINTIGLLTPSAAPAATEAILKTDATGKTTFQTLQVAGVAYIDDTLDFGTDTMYEDASYLRVAGAKPVYFGQTIQSGSAWSINTSGDFAGRDVGGRDATFTEDLYAAATAFRVINHTHDYAHAHVVVNPGGSWTLDEQFGVDIDDNLLVRGYIVGKHALQIKDALMICHYDGPETPGNLVGNPAGHMGQVATVSGDVVYRPGKFNKGVEITDSYTNLCTNPSFETNTTGWTNVASGTAAGTRTRTSEDSYDGLYSYRFDKSAGANGDHYGARFDLTVTNGVTYSVSCKVKLTATTGSTGNVARLYVYGGSGVNVYAYTDTVGEWVELTATATANGTALQVFVGLLNCTTGTVYFDAVQVTATSAQRPYWGGGSARSNGSLSYTNIPVNWAKCTAMCWFRTTATAIQLGRNLRLFELRYNDNNRINLRINDGDDKLVGYVAGGGVTAAPTSTGTVSTGTWHHAAIVVESGTTRIYLDGAEVGTAAIAGAASGLATVWVGMYNAGERMNGMVDDFVIVNRALPADEVRAVYESNAPVFAETSTWHWRGGRNRVWADAEGLWMLSADSNAVLGAYAGDDLDAGATKAWGGFTLGEGDIALGHNRTGSSGILWDRSAGTFGFYGNGGATPTVVIGTDGTLYAGTAGAARVQMQAAELAGYSSANVRQWYGSTTDGKLYGAEGVAWIDQYGFGVAAPPAADLGMANAIKWFKQTSPNTQVAYINASWNGTSGNENGDMILYARKGAGGAAVGRVYIYADELREQSNTNLYMHGVYVVGDNAGVAGTTGLTNVVDTGISTGVGSVKMAGTTARTNTGWLKIYVGTAARYIPYWTTITG
jgi:hypothetical protein